MWPWIPGRVVHPQGKRTLSSGGIHGVLHLPPPQHRDLTLMALQGRKDQRRSHHFQETNQRIQKILFILGFFSFSHSKSHDFLHVLTSFSFLSSKSSCLVPLKTNVQISKLFSSPFSSTASQPASAPGTWDCLDEVILATSSVEVGAHIGRKTGMESQPQSGS